MPNLWSSVWWPSWAWRQRKKERVYVREILFTADIDWIHMYVRASTSFKPSYSTFIIYTAALTTSLHSFSRVELTLGVDDSDALWSWGKTSTDIPALAVVNMYISFEESWSLDVVRHKAECKHILSRFLRILYNTNSDFFLPYVQSIGTKIFWGAYMRHIFTTDMETYLKSPVLKTKKVLKY